MAKAKAIKELDCAADAHVWAEKVLSVRIGEVVALRDSALDFSDIEGVHDMRVAARRLRSALRDFRPLADKGRLKKASKELQKLADALGQVRDQDVAIDALNTLAGKAAKEPVKAGIKKLSAERLAARDSARRKLTAMLGKSDVAKLHDRFTDALDKAFEKNGGNHAVSFNQAGRACVTAGLDDFLDLSPGIYQPSNNDHLHRLRVAAKRLRYAIELFVACWGDKIAPFAEEIAKMQTFLGEVHDCDVWIESLGRYLIREEKKEKTATDRHVAAAWLLSEFAKKRNAQYLSALALWANWERNNFVENMRATVSRSS